MGLDDIMGLDNIMGLDMMELDNIAVPISLFFSVHFILYIRISISLGLG